MGLETTEGRKFLPFPRDQLFRHSEFRQLAPSAQSHDPKDEESRAQDGLNAAEKYICDICGDYRTNRRRNLDSHQRNQHGGNESGSQSSIRRKRGPPKQLNLVSGTVYRCDQCPDYVTSNEKYLYYHKRNCHSQARYHCDQCGYVTRLLSSLRRHLATLHEQVRHPCHVCSFQASSKHLLKVHIQSKHEVLEFLCDQCDFRCKISDSLRRHKRERHEGRQWVCGECDFVATSGTGELRRHVAKIHTARLFQCDQCDYQIGRSHDLKRHIRVKHLNQKFGCQVCEYQVTRASALRKHMRKEHPTEGDTTKRE